MPEPVTLPRSAVHPLRSRHAEADFQIWVAEPRPNPRVPVPEAYRVLYVTDADLFFGTAVDMSRLMHALFAELPPLLVVGVAYGADDPAVQGEIRNRDLTPSADPGFEAMARRMDPSWEPLLPEGRRMGRADAFLDCLEHEVIPLVAEHHPLAMDGHTLFGSSLGGLFTLYAFLTRPEVFSHYIAASPAIWWDGEMLFGVEERVASERDDLAASLFLGVGSLEEGVGLPWLDEFRTVTNVHKMADRLAGRGYPSLEVVAHVFEGETHTSVVPATLTRGLRSAYPR